MPGEEFGIQIANTIIGIVPYVVGIFIVAVIVLVIAKWKGGKEEDEMVKPPILEPEEKFIELHKNLLRLMGRKLNHRSVFKLGMQEVCLVKRWMPIYISEKEKVNLKKLKKKTDMEELKEIMEGKEYNPENHYILEVLNFGIFNAILYALGYRMNYFIIPIKLINTENTQNWNCTEDLYGKPYFDRVFIFSLAAKKYMEDFHDHMTTKQTLRNQVNYIPQMQYHDFVTGKYAAKSREYNESKRKNWSSREENLEKEVDE